MGEAKFGEPWRVSSTETMEVVADSGDPITWEEHLEARSVACVNALSGIENPAAYVEALEELAKQFDLFCRLNSFDHPAKEILARVEAAKK